MAPAVIDTALTLADKIVSLISTHVKGGKFTTPSIKGEDLQNLQQLTANLQQKLKATSDMQKFIFVLKQAEIPSSQASQLKEVSETVWTNSIFKGDEENNAAWTVVSTSISRIGIRIDALADALSLLPDDYRSKYELDQKDALLHLANAGKANDWEVIKLEMDLVSQSLSKIVSDIGENINKMTAALFPTTPTASLK